MDAGMRMGKLADAVGNVGNLSGLGYAETRKRLLDAVTGITRDALDSYRPFLNESRIQSIAEPMEDGKRLPAGYRKKVNPMFVTRARSCRELGSPFETSVVRSVRAMEEYLSVFEDSKTDPVLLVRGVDSTRMAGMLETILSNYAEAKDELNSFINGEKDEDPDREFRNIASIFNHVFETVYRKVSDFLSAYLGIFDGNTGRVYNLLEKMLAADRTVISNGFRSDVRAVRNAVSHSIFERKGDGYRLHDDPGKYSREFTAEELHTFAVRCLEKSAIVLDMVVAMTSMTLYHLLVTAYRGSEQ